MSFKVLNGQDYIEKDRNAVLNYTYHLEKWCAKAGVSLVSYQLIPLPGCTVVVDEDQRSGDTVSMMVSGGEVDGSIDPCGTTLRDGVTCRFTTTNGPLGVPLTDDRTIFFLIINGGEEA